MPIYEFYCPDCHTVFSFFSSGVDTSASPACPACRRPRLARQPSTFATLKTSSEGDAGFGEEGFPELGDERMAGAMEEALAGLPEGSEDDPRQMARLLRQFGAAAGMEAGPKLEAMLARLEAGESAEDLEDELAAGEEGDAGSLDDFFRTKRGARARKGRPKVDRELYFL